MKTKYFLLSVIVMLMLSNHILAQCGIAIAPVSVTVCAGNGVQITVSDTSTSNTNPFLWSPALGLNSTAGATVIATPASTTTYIVTKVNCSDKDSILVIVNPLPIPTIAITENSGKINNDGILCAGDSALLNAGNFGSYLWSNGFTSQTISAKAAGNYIVTVTDVNGCTATASVVVIVNPLPNPLISISENSGNTLDDGILCLGDFANLSVGNYASYLWSTGASVNNIDVNSGGNFSISVINGNGCTANTTATIIINNLPTANIVSPAGICTGSLDSVIFTGTAGTPPFTFTYTKNGINLSVTTTTGNTVKVAIATGLANTSTYVLKSVTDANGCSQTYQDTAITIVSDAPTLNQKANRVACNGSVTPLVNFNGAPAGSTVTWTCSVDIGFGTSGIGNITATTVINLTTLPIIATITATASVSNCNGTPMTFTITVNPTPQINSLINQSFCNGDTIANGIPFSSLTPNATFSWTGTKNIGFGVSGNDSIPGFAAVNSTNNPLITLITISISANSCQGPDSTFTVTVNPTPFANSLTDTTYCNGTAATAINFNSPTVGATFSWTSNFDVGFGTSSTGSISAYTAKNLLFYPVTATIVVSTSINNCTGTDSLFSITVNPTPKVFVSNYDTIYCGGNTVPPIFFSSTSPDSIIHWSINNYNVGLLVDSGINQIPSFIASDTASTQKTTQVTYYATTLQGCTGAIEKFKLKVKPSPVVNPLISITVCNNEQVNLPDFTSPTDSVNFIWIGNTDIGFGTYGLGSIPSFTAVNLDTVTLYDTIAVRAEKECTGSDTMEFVIVVNPSPKVNPVNNFVVCDSSDFTYTFTSPLDSIVYEWTNSNTNSGLPTNGNGNIPLTTLSNPPDTAVIQSVITVTPYYKVNGNCAGDTMQFKIFVSPKPNVSSTLKDTVFCSGLLVNLPLSGTIPNTVYNWSNSNTTIGLAANGIGNTLSFLSINNSSVPQSGTIIVKPNYTLNGSICEGDSFSFDIKINPTPDINSIADITLCSGESFTDIIFNGNVLQSVFKWSNDNTNSGLVASGNDTIYGQVLANDSLNKIVSTITATPYYVDTNGCIGISKTFTITVNPKPNLSGTLPLTDTTFCNNVAAFIPLKGTIANATYSWTNSNTNIGLSDSTGTGDNLSFTTNNTSLTPDSSQIWVYSYFTTNGITCIGDSTTFKIYINPSPTIFPISNRTLCDADQDTILFTGSVPGISYSWTNSNTNIGINASGSGNSLLFTANNSSTTTSDSATITVIASFTFNNKNCIGNSISFKIFVNPVAIITSTQTNPVVCNGDTISLPPFSSSLGNNATINWNHQGPFLGLASVGTGNIAPFKSVNSGNTILKDTVFVAASINGCKGPDSTFTITVNPTPIVLPITNTTYCNGDTVAAIPLNSNVLNSSFNWSSSVNFGGTNTSGTSSFYPSFIAVNDSSVQKIYTVKTIANANGCNSDTVTFTVTINPSPKLINSIIDSVCDGIALSYSALSNVTGTSYNWERFPVTGITNLYNTDSNNLITEVLLNNTTSSIDVVYEFTLTANGCASKINETTTVKPSPRMNTVSDKVFCNGSTMPEIILTSTPPADTVYWFCTNSIGYDVFAGIGNMPIDTALNNNPFADSAFVLLEAIANGCYSNEPDSVFKIVVNPSPASPQFTSIVDAPNPISLCGGSQNINFNVNNPLISNGITYLWNVNNLSVATIASPNNPNTVISFNNTSDTIIVTASAFNTAANGSCAATVSQQVILNQNNSNNINEQKIILKQPGNLLVYPDNSMANDSGYQWGYDLKISDTLLGPPQSIFNQHYQIFTPGSNFIIDTLSKIQLDTFKYCFWVLVKKGDCQSKVYYNGPYKNKPAIVINNTSDAAIAITPNPASEYFDFTLTGKIYGNIQLKISNGLGQQIFQSNFVKKQAELTQRIMLNNLQNGIYHLELFSSDQQSLSTKIVVYH